MSRLWISSLTPDAIREGLRRTAAGRDYDGLADAARGRSRADWLVGMNLSRAYTLAYGEELSVGRVQTPTLAMLVERELAIRRLRPGRLPGSGGHLPPAGTPETARTRARGFATGRGADRNAAAGDAPAADGEEAKQIVARARGPGRRPIESIEAETQRMPPPLLYDLTELQRHANRLFGFSAQKTLDTGAGAVRTAQADQLSAYRQPASVAGCGAHAAESWTAIAGRIASMLAPGTGERPLGRRFVDDAKVTDHHAIIPTGDVAANGVAVAGRAQDLRPDLPAPA